MDYGRVFNRGLTWFEMLVTLLLIAVLGTVAIPTFRQQQAESLVTSTASTLLGAAHFARSEALLRNRPTVLCLSRDGQRCLESRGDANGWLLFVDLHRGRSAQIDPGDLLLRQGSIEPRILLRGTRAAITYWPSPNAGTTATITICAALGATGGPARPRALIVSQTGRPRMQRLPLTSPACAA